MMIEPTESESREELDLLIDALKQIAREAEENPELVQTAPHTTRVQRLDETTAARKPILRGRLRSLRLRWQWIQPRRSGRPCPSFMTGKTSSRSMSFMMGEARGRLAVTLDVLTDALILVGQHGVYCTSARNPKVPALDLQAVLANITGANELVASVMEKLRLEKEAAE